MKKRLLLNHALSGAIASMGHMDRMTIVDCGYPIPPGAHCIDLALKRGTPGFVETLDTVLDELCVENIVIASELPDENPAVYKELKNRFPGGNTGSVAHEEFKRLAQSSKAFVRTGENTPYANVMLISGVQF